MKALFTVFLLSCISCTGFSRFSQFNDTQNCFESYVCISNPQLGLKYQSYGGFKFASDLKTYRKLKKDKRPHFRNIIIYGSSENLSGDYYLLLDNKKYPGNYRYKDTVIAGRKITIALSRSVDYKANTDFLLNFKLGK